MSQASGVPLEELRQYMFLYHDREATEHIMRVAGGLDSLVMGEGQILAQVHFVPILSHLFVSCFMVQLQLNAKSSPGLGWRRRCQRRRSRPTGDCAFKPDAQTLQLHLWPRLTHVFPDVPGTLPCR